MKINLLFSLSAVLVLFFLLELSFRRTKFLISIIDGAFLTLTIILPHNLIWVYFDFLLMGNLLLIIFIFLIFTKWASYEFKGVYTLYVSGFLLCYWAYAFQGEIKSLSIVPLFVVPLLFIMGIVILILPLIINPKYISDSLKFWYLVSFLIFIASIIISVIFLLLVPQTLILVLFFGIPLNYGILRTLILVKSEKKTPTNIQSPSILEIFTRPSRITEEEISISKEKKICLVCKGKLTRKIYLCPECNAFYCEKCSVVLIGLENACWVCEAPFDESKPVKGYNKIEDGTLVDEKPYKK